MCGIAGIYHFGNDRAADRDLVVAMRDRLTHRGPDDAGVWVDGPIGLAQRRLSIVDLSEAGRNPMPNEDGSLQLTYNGEVYNVLERRAEFEARGHVMRSHTDSEMLLHLYEEKGVDFLAGLRGMFALALWDAPRQRLLVARDAAGKKPLYWRADGGTFAFASELKALAADPAMRRAVDPHALHAYLTLQYVPSPHSIFEGVRRLPPGSLLLVTKDGVEERTWWRPPAGEPPLALDDDAAAAELRGLLEEAVRLRFMSDVPLGAFLSGGIDSSLVCALMARQMDRPVKTFTIGFEGAPEDESVHARAVARHLGAEHHEFVVRPDALAILPWLVWHLDEPLADASALPTWAVSEMARAHVTVVLSGDGGDETFAGYETYRLADSYRAVDRLPGAVRRSAAALAHTGLVNGRWGRRLHRLGEDPVARHLGLMSNDGAEVRALLAPALRARLAADDPFAEARARVAGLDPRDPQTLLHLDFTTYMTDDVLAKVDRMSMAHALEVRVPLLDTKVVEFAARLPYHQKWRAGTSKWLLKRVARDLLPPVILERGKQGFGVPLERWFGGRFDAVVRTTLSAETLARRGLFDGAAVERLVARATAPVPDRAAGRLVWALLVFELWAQAYLDRAGERPAGERPRLVARETRFAAEGTRS